jgi:uncharacterized protein YacL
MQNGTTRPEPVIEFDSIAPKRMDWLLLSMRIVFLLTLLGIGLAAFRHFTNGSPFQSMSMTAAVFALTGIFGLGVIIVMTDVMIRQKQITTLSAVYFGLLLGLLLGNILTTALDPFLFDWQPNSKMESPLRKGLGVLLSVIACYICVSLLLQTKDDFRFVIPYVEFSRQVKGSKSLLLDTSVIIDGRIADLCETRLFDNRLIVPRFVLNELQMVADSGDRLKRNRGRRGLDILKRMQTNPKLEIQFHDGTIAGAQDVRKVDERLVLLARALDARVVTNDFNLNKIAQIQGVEVINLNELANALKSVALPGEIMQIKVVKAGDQQGQGVGYLEDGTMVVIEAGRQFVNQDILITVTSVIQTPAGRMIFGRAERTGAEPKPNEPKFGDGRQPDLKPVSTIAANNGTGSSGNGVTNTVPQGGSNDGPPRPVAS